MTQPCDVARLLALAHAAAPVAVARIVGVRGYGAREPGGVLTITADRRVSGTLGIETIEADIARAARHLLTGAPSRLLHYDIPPPGHGSLDVLIQRLEDGPDGLSPHLLLRAATLRAQGLTPILATRLEDGTTRLLLHAPPPLFAQGWFHQPLPPEKPG